MRIVIPQEDENQKKELSKKFKDYEIDYAEADIGGGADWWITIIILGGALFFQGKNISKLGAPWNCCNNFCLFFSVTRTSVWQA